MKIAIIGFGKMGHAVEAVALAAKHEVVAKIDPAFAKAAAGKPSAADATAAEISAENLNGAEVAIDFTHPDIVLENLKKLTELKVPTVVGTTGWYDQLPEVEKMVSASGAALLYAGNFSVGVQTFYAIVENAAKLLSDRNFDVAIHETHHTQKADAPSGTAKEIAAKILANFPAKKEIVLDNSEQPVPADKLQISASRVGKIFGIHEVTFDGSSDTIQIIHTSKNRDALATGAVSGAEWLVKNGQSGLFTAADWLGL